MGVFAHIFFLVQVVHSKSRFYIFTHSGMNNLYLYGGIFASTVAVFHVYKSLTRTTKQVVIDEGYVGQLFLSVILVLGLSAYYNSGEQTYGQIFNHVTPQSTVAPSVSATASQPQSVPQPSVTHAPTVPLPSFGSGVVDQSLGQSGAAVSGADIHPGDYSKFGQNKPASTPSGSPIIPQIVEQPVGGAYDGGYNI